MKGKRNPLTIQVMKKLYRNKKLSVMVLNLSEEELKILKNDYHKFRGFNFDYNNHGEIETIGLSSAGIRYVERLEYKERAIEHISNNIYQILSVVMLSVTAITGIIQCCIRR